ncbi:hypothetical protein RB199_20040 [Streptomyces libani]|uniref:hypothetical protein n=1 Tax=Streptomyces TaxID=1883 RepID=UPI0013A55198|nr:hypothetical protein [Streptomyces sp. NEAU-S7GS2]
MRSLNEHHRFEDLCRALARQRITRNILAATGPVSAGGDQGRDFETFLSYNRSSIQDAGIFFGLENSQLIVFCCTLQTSNIRRKILADVATVMKPTQGPSVEAIFYFTEVDISVGMRHKLTQEALAGYGVRVELIDGNSLTELLSEPEMLWIAREYLNASPELIGGMQESSAVGRVLNTGSVIVRSIFELDPIRDLGVHPPMQLDEWVGMTPYIRRSVDDDLDTLINEVGGLVVLEGNSASGKTRTAYEVLARSAERGGERAVVVPKDGISLRALISAGFKLENTVVWLDDLEKFIGADGLDEGLIRLFGTSGVLFLATLRSAAKHAMASATAGGLGRSLSAISKAVMAGATSVRVDRSLNEREIRSVNRQRADLRISMALEKARHAGLAEFIAAGPATLERWRDGQDGANEVGAALVSAAVDFRRAGYFSPIPQEWIEAACSVYLDPRTRQRMSQAHFDTAFLWATEILHGASSCLEVVGDRLFSPFDYLVDHIQDQEEEENRVGRNGASRILKTVPDVIWHEIQDRISVNDPSFMSCVATSSLSFHPGLRFRYELLIENGVVSQESLNDSGVLLNFVRSCTEANLCIPCHVGLLQLDMETVLKVLLDEFDTIPKTEDSRLSESQLAVVRGLFSLADNEANLSDPESPIHAAAVNLPPRKWEEVGDFFLSHGAPTEGRLWRLFAAAQRGEPVKWPVSLKKNQGVLILDYPRNRDGGTDVS